MLTKEKIKSLLVCAILSLALGVFVLCFCSMNVAVYAESSTSTAFSFTYDSATVLYDSANEVYNVGSDYTGTNHTLIATYLGTDTITDFKWFYKNDTTSNATEVLSGFAKMKPDNKSTTLYIKNVSQSGLYYLAVYNNGALVAQSKDIKLTIVPVSINLNITDVSVKTYDGTNKIAITSDFVDTMLAEGDKNKGLEVVGVLNTIDAGENIYIEKIALSDDSLTQNYNITANYNISRYVTVNKAKAKIQFNWSEIGINQEGSSYAVNYSGEDYALKIKAQYIDVSGKSVDVKYTYAYESGLKKANYLTNAGEYVLTVIKQESDKNYNFVDSNGSEFGSQRFKIKKIDPVFSQWAPTYTGLTQSLNDFVKVNNSEQTISFSGVSSFTTCQDWNNIKGNSFSVAESENYCKKTGNFSAYDMQKATPTFMLNKNEYEYNDGSEIALDYFLTTGLTAIQKTEIKNVGRYTSVELYVAGNENYLEKTFYVEVTVNKKEIDVSGLSWEYDKDNKLTYKGENYELSIKDDGQYEITNKIDIEYTNNKQMNAGTYCANAVATIKQDYASNYSIVGKIEPLYYTIKKRGVTRPSVASQKDLYGNIKPFVYNGEEQQIELNPSMESKYYNFSNNIYTYAGDYTAIVSLKDINNLMWADGKIEDIKLPWKIQKQIVDIGSYKTVLVYSGLEQGLKVKENDLYYVIGDRAIDIGSYKTILVLKDKNNYAFDEAGNGEYTINWRITGDKEKAGLPIALIILVTILVTAFGVYITLHYTFITKEKKERKKRLEQKMEKLNKVE